jgi:hypothetical protein
MIAVLFALLAAAGNALAPVLQRRAARSAPEEFAFRPVLLWRLIRRPVWLGGIGAVIAGFLLQALALPDGGLALVQPLLVAGYRIRLHRHVHEGRTCPSEVTIRCKAIRHWAGRLVSSPAFEHIPAKGGEMSAPTNSEAPERPKTPKRRRWPHVPEVS